jgi:hypothetical protein
MVVFDLMNRLDIALHLYEQGVVDREALRGYSEGVLALLASPGVAAWWKKEQNWFNPNVREFINPRLRTTRAPSGDGAV